jgi:hypothetical protein
MSNAYEVNSSPAANYSTFGGTEADMTNLSPESLLAYCQLQLGDLDTQIGKQVNAQKMALREREAVESAQTVLEQFGTDGPKDAPQMHQCVTAIDNAIARLPPGDPVAAKLADFRQKMCTQYNYDPPRSLTSSEQAELNNDISTDNTAAGVNGGNQVPYQWRVDQFNQIQTDGILGNAPNPDKKEWQGTTDALSTLTNDIKSNADIEMLQLQDLVSQRQQAIQLCSGMMSKSDQTLEDQAKAIGR